jgi:hypothetical protein
MDNENEILQEITKNIYNLSDEVRDKEYELQNVFKKY